MRICVFMHRFDDGGAERVTVRLLNELHRRGHEITLAVRYNEGLAKEALLPYIRVVDMALPREGKLKKNILNVRHLIRLMRSGEYDVMVSILSDMSQVAAFSKWLCGSKLPLVSVVHSTLSVEKMTFRKVRNLLMRFFDRRYNKVITVSEAVRQDYIRCCGALPDKVVTVYNPIVDENMLRLAQVTPEHPWLAKDRDFITLLLAGRLSYPKNHALMLRTLKLLRQKGDYRLLLLGEGELRQDLMALTAALGLTPWVDFHGYVKNPYSYMAQADCVVLSSVYEGLPTVLVEALACGSRIVSTDCPSGPREILGHRFGTLVPVSDEQALAGGILEALKAEPDKALLLSRAMDFTVENATVRFEQELQQLL